MRALARWFGADAVAGPGTGGCDGWRRDPLSHPSLDAMNLVELADLPGRQLNARRRE